MEDFMEIFGCAATSDVDRAGERVLLDGMDIADIKLFNDEHASERMFEILGNISQAVKIYTEKECADEYQLKCWKLLKRPFLYVRGSIADEQGHPNAQAAAALIKFGQQNPDFKVGLSVEGMTLERRGTDLVRTKVRNVSLTVKPANPHTFIFPVIDLAKSHAPAVLPEQYRDVEGRKQFRSLPDDKTMILAKSGFLQELKELLKSDAQTVEGAAVIKCWNCGTGKVFMKSRLPNRCGACGEGFTMKDIYSARCSKPFF
jgi:hypothetical protein